MKVVTAGQMKAIDTRAIEKEGVPGLKLMENAGKGCVASIRKMLGKTANKKVAIIAGKGNNGGDGFVIARLLKGKKARVSVFLLGKKAQVKGDAATNLKRLKTLKVREIS